jgi:hypothetical protein
MRALHSLEPNRAAFTGQEVFEKDRRLQSKAIPHLPQQCVWAKGVRFMGSPGGIPIFQTGGGKGTIRLSTLATGMSNSLSLSAFSR